MFVVEGRITPFFLRFCMYFALGFACGANVLVVPTEIRTQTSVIIMRV